MEDQDIDPILRKIQEARAQNNIIWLDLLSIGEEEPSVRGSDLIKRLRNNEVLIFKMNKSLKKNPKRFKQILSNIIVMDKIITSLCEDLINE